MTEHRVFHRVQFITTVEVTAGDAVHPAGLLDISMKGALLELHDEARLENGSTCKLAIHLNLSDIVLFMEGMVIHREGNRAGVKFTRIDLESMTHLRRLLELNTDNPDQVRHELEALMQVH